MKRHKSSSDIFPLKGFLYHAKIIPNLKLFLPILVMMMSLAIFQELKIPTFSLKASLLEYLSTFAILLDYQSHNIDSVFFCY